MSEDRKTYRLKDDLSREQMERLVDALLPFYGIGSVLGCADGGTVTITLYAGKPSEEVTNPQGVTYLKIAQPEDYENEIEITEETPEGVILGASGSYRGVPASYLTSPLRVKHFTEATRAFLDCIEDVPNA